MTIDINDIRLYKNIGAEYPMFKLGPPASLDNVEIIVMNDEGVYNLVSDTDRMADKVVVQILERMCDLREAGLSDRW